MNKFNKDYRGEIGLLIAVFFIIVMFFIFTINFINIFCQIYFSFFTILFYSLFVNYLLN